VVIRVFLLDDHGVVRRGLVDGIHRVAAGQSLLSEQERRILEHVAEGLTNREIAARMFLAEKTVKNYVSSLLAKLGLERWTQAAVLATRLLGEHPPRSGAPATGPRRLGRTALWS